MPSEAGAGTGSLKSSRDVSGKQRANSMTLQNVTGRDKNYKSGQAPHRSQYRQYEKIALWGKKAGKVKMEGKSSEVVQEDTYRQWRCHYTCHCP